MWNLFLPVSAGYCSQYFFSYFASIMKYKLEFLMTFLFSFTWTCSHIQAKITLNLIQSLFFPRNIHVIWILMNKWKNLQDLTCNYQWSLLTLCLLQRQSKYIREFLTIPFTYWVCFLFILKMREKFFGVLCKSKLLDFHLWWVLIVYILSFIPLKTIKTEGQGLRNLVESLRL